MYSGVAGQSCRLDLQGGVAGWSCRLGFHIVGVVVAVGDHVCFLQLAKFAISAAQQAYANLVYIYVFIATAFEFSCQQSLRDGSISEKQTTAQLSLKIFGDSLQIWRSYA